MLTPKTSAKRHLTKLVNISFVILTVSILVACATPGLPTPPEGNLYLHDAPRQQALCTKFNSGTPCAAKDIDDTDLYYMISPDDFEGLMNYIDKLVIRLESATTPMAVGSPGAAIPVYKSDLQRGKSILKKSKDRLHRQL